MNYNLLLMNKQIMYYKYIIKYMVVKNVIYALKKNKMNVVLWIVVEKLFVNNVLKITKNQIYYNLYLN